MKNVVNRNRMLADMFFIIELGNDNSVSTAL